MRLTLALLRKKHVIPGNQWLGKHRLPHRVYEHNVANMVTKLELEEKNLFFLRHPYLTPEQEIRQLRETREFNGVAIDKRLRACNVVKPSVRVEDRLAMLNNGDNWENYK